MWQCLYFESFSLERDLLKNANAPENMIDSNIGRR